MDDTVSLENWKESKTFKEVTNWEKYKNLSRNIVQWKQLGMDSVKTMNESWHDDAGMTKQRKKLNYRHSGELRQWYVLFEVNFILE